MLKLAPRPLYLLPALTVIALGLLAEPTFATFVVFAGNDPQPDQENVTFENDLIGTSLQGATNQTSTEVNVASAGQFLASQGPGLEARELLDINSSQVAIEGSITVSLLNPNLAFGSLTFNAFNGGPVGDGGTLTVTVTGYESDGTPVSTTLTEIDGGGSLAVGNGANFFTVVALDGQKITSVEISADAGTSYAGLQQLRVGAIVPEPATWALFGLALTALVVRNARMVI